MYWNEEIECMGKEQMRELQSKRLIDTVKRVYENVPFYRKKMEEAGVKPEDIRSVDDLHKLPFTTKIDLRDNYPFNTFACPMEDVVRIHASSGTTGKQTVVGYTAHDLEVWSECVARGMTALGVTKKDRVHVSYGYGLFTGGLGAHGGAEYLGATVVPASTGNTSRQVRMLVDFQSTVLCCTPSYALYIADEMQKMGITKDQLNLKYGCFGAEPWTEHMRTEIENKLGLEAHDIYGLSEIMGPGVSMDCTEKNGLHIHADHFIPEIINPETGEVLPEGEEGELVFTCITKQALPLIRYRTKDLSRLTWETCGCGRTLPRMEKVTGRCDDMLIIRGVNVFPSQIESVLLEYGQVEPHYMIYVDRKGLLDTMEVHVEMTEELFSDAVRNIEAHEKKLRQRLESVLGISAAVKLVEPRSIPRSEGKAKRVIDNRKLV